MKKNHCLFVIAALALTVINCRQAAETNAAAQAASTPDARITATVYNSNFEHAHDTYNGLSSASDGKIYYVLCSELMDIAGQMYSFDPADGRIEHLADLSEICNEKGMRVVAQGKSHVNFYEYNGKLYFATHLGYYSIIDGMEKTGIPTNGYHPYRGGHFLSYDLKSKTFEDLALAPHEEGILTMEMDTRRGMIYGLTWPTGRLLRYDVAKKTLQDLGPATGKGENGVGPEFRVICRSMAINPEDGAVYFTNAEGEIKRLKAGEDNIEIIAGEDMRKDYFGSYEASTAGSMAYNWRQVFWYAAEKQIYGVHGNSGYLFRFDPALPRLEVLQRLTSLPSQRSGMNDQFSYGYLGFKLGPDGRTIYYLTGAPIYENGKRVLGAAATARGEAKGLEDLHLITYDIPTQTYRDHGAVFYPDGQRPLYVNSIAIGGDGTVYTLARIKENGKTRTDLISFPGPFRQ
ncbi:MAG TPA: hypothetical protein PK843_17085 [bacterium]|nr:hypothetical protein [bacterium]HPN36224.1 hypothetical protein [bacterium]